MKVGEKVSSLPDIALVNRFPSESTQESTLTKSATKLGTEQEKIASHSHGICPLESAGL